MSQPTVEGATNQCVGVHRLNGVGGSVTVTSCGGNLASCVLSIALIVILPSIILAVLQNVTPIYIIDAPAVERTQAKPCPQEVTHSVLKTISLPLGPVPENAIHFVLSDGSSRVKLREICSVESAAVHHPGKPVVVNLMSPQLQWTEVLDHLNNTHPNVQFVQLDLRERLSGTPMGDGWVDKGLLEVKPKYKKNYISDIVRMATVYKYGGAYLDADMLVMRSFDEFRNAIPTEFDEILANGNFMAFDKEHPFLYDVLEYLASSFSTDGYAHNGPPAVTRVMYTRRWCTMTIFRKLRRCRGGIRLLPAVFFNPIDYKEVLKTLMANQSIDSIDVENAIQKAYSVHLYHSQSQESCVHVDDFSVQPISSLLKKGCPGVVEKVKEGYFR